MPEVVYYVAMSLDGYIATPDGGVDWLPTFNASDGDYGYSKFYASIDALLMGSRTYEQSLTFGGWPYEGMPCWVFSHRPLDAAQAEVTITNSTPKEVIAELNERDLHRAWLVGGAALATSFRSAGLISEYVVSVIPTILGDGIPLFDTGGPSEKLALAESKQFSGGLVQLRYVKSNDV
jgi:dihydrofolate reductase